METRSSTPVPWNRYPLRSIRTVLALIALIGLSLGLFRAWPGASNGLIALAVFGAPPAYIARNTIGVKLDRGETARVEDRVALFLSLSLFTVPIQLYVFSQFVFYRHGWEPGPVGRVIYDWWLTVFS